MPFFKQSNIEKYTPKTLTFSQLYAHNVKGPRKVGASVIDQAKNALLKAGVNENEVQKIISHDQPISVSRMKEVAAVLNRSQIYGFEKNQDFRIKDLLNKERIKAQSIAGIMKEHLLEAMDEDLPLTAATSLNQRGVSPNKPLPKEKSRAVFSLSRTKSSKPTGSLSSTGRASSISSKPSNGSNLKPKF